MILIRVLQRGDLTGRRPRLTRAYRQRIAFVKAYSENRKLGRRRMHATYAAQSTCPPSCPFYGAGCYAETGHIGIYAAQPMRGAAAGVDPCAVAVVEAAAIDAAPATRDLRLHVLGDMHCAGCARRIAAAVGRYLGRARRPVRAFTYTHNHTIPRTAFGPISALRSCETAAQVRAAHAAGFGAALVTLRSPPPNGRAYAADGYRVVPCPYETRGVGCADCRLCLDGDRLAAARIAIGFTPHSAGAARVRATVGALTGGTA